MGKSLFASKEEIRRTIREYRVARLRRGQDVVSIEPHLLGTRKGGGVTLVAWVIGEGWDSFPYTEIRGFESTDEIYARTRDGYKPDDPRMSSIDTAASIKP